MSVDDGMSHSFSTASVCVSQCSLSGSSLSVVTAGIPASFHIKAADGYGNAYTSDDVSFRVAFASGAAEETAVMAHRGGGSSSEEHFVSFLPLYVGEYAFSIQEVASSAYFPSESLPLLQVNEGSERTCSQE